MTKRASADLPEVAGATCAGCGVAIPSSDVMFSDVGEVCPACFGERELPATRGGAMRLAGQALLPAPLAVLGLACAWATLTAGPVGGRNSLSFLAVAAGLTGIGLMLSLQALKDLKVATRPDDDGHVRWGPVASAAVAVALSVGATVALALATASPLF